MSENRIYFINQNHILSCLNSRINKRVDTVQANLADGCAIYSIIEKVIRNILWLNIVYC